MAAALAILGATAPPAHARRGTDPERTSRAPLRSGAYVLVAPGTAQLRLQNRGYPRMGAAWAWGVAGGYVWRPDRLLRMSVGASFEHAPLRFADRSYSGQEFRFLPILRVGAGSDRFFGYGAVGTGVGLLVVDVPDALADEERIGLDLKLAAGAQMVVWRGLFFGAEASFDLAFYGGMLGAATLPGERNDFRTDGLWLRLVGGWYF
ncbi:MAG: hypothetical protein ACRBN8_07295 [Nannocystales bacterium]